MRKLIAVLVAVTSLSIVSVAQGGKKAAIDVNCGQYNVCTFTASGGSAQWEFSDWKIQFGSAAIITQNPYQRGMSTHSPVDGSTPYTTTVVNLLTNDTVYVQCKGDWSPHGSMCKKVNKP